MNFINHEFLSQITHCNSLSLAYDFWAFLSDPFFGLLSGERVIMVSHGGTIRGLYRHARSPMKPLGGKIHNRSVSVILVSGATGRCIVKMVGDISHLQETGVLENAFGGDGTSASMPSVTY